MGPFPGASTQEEYVDIVDESGRVLSSAFKSDVHHRGLLHKTVVGEIINSRTGEWVLVQQARDRQDPGQYVSFIGGHVRAGETEEDALRREAREEASFTASDYTLSFKGRARFERFVLNRNENHLFVLFEVFSEKDPIFNEEGMGIKKFTEEDLWHNLKERPHDFGDAFWFVVKTFYPRLLGDWKSNS